MRNDAALGSSQMRLAFEWFDLAEITMDAARESSRTIADESARLALEQALKARRELVDHFARQYSARNDHEAYSRMLRRIDEANEAVVLFQAIVNDEEQRRPRDMANGENALMVRRAARLPRPARQRFEE